MSKINYHWKVSLRENRLTKDVENDRIAEVSTAGNTITNAHIARDIKEEGSELSEETLLDILNRADRHRRRRLQDGFSIQTGLVHLLPRVKGNWVGEHPVYDPGEHKITADATLTAETRAALEEVTVDVVNIQTGGGAYINMVTDVITGKADGHITPGDDLLIEGDKIKIAAPQDVNDAGVFFLNEAGDAIRASMIYIENTPKKLIIRIPNLTTGTYRLQVRTYFSQGSVFLKELRTIEYNQPLTVS